MSKRVITTATVSPSTTEWIYHIVDFNGKLRTSFESSAAVDTLLRLAREQGHGSATAKGKTITLKTTDNFTFTFKPEH